MKSRFYCFCKVVELGNFTRAAEQLGYSQSAVSQMVKTFESELGATLIERRKDGIAILPIDTQPRRTMLLAWKRRDALPLAAQKFADLLIDFSRR